MTELWSISGIPEIRGRYAKQLNVVEDVRLLNESLGIRKICLILFR